MEDKLQFDEGLSLNDVSQYHLLQTARWGKFLAIAGFIMCGLLVVFGLGFGFFMSSMISQIDTMSPGMGSMYSGMGLFYVGIAALYFFPTFNLFKFSKKAKIAIESQDSDEIAASLDQLHSLFKFMGILTIIILGFYAIALVFGLIAAVGFAAFA